MKITDVVFDFDGTCTKIPAIYEAYLNRYLQELNSRIFSAAPALESDWKMAHEQVRAASPKAGWTLKETPAAPAAADPYILAFESARHLIRKKGLRVDPPYEAHSNSNDTYPAPWRDDSRTVFETLQTKGIRIHFISNSSSSKITRRLLDLLLLDELPKEKIKVVSDAAKFNLNELTWDLTVSDTNRKTFESLPEIVPGMAIGRPVYLRRGSYFEAILKAFNNDLTRLQTTVFCGDIWEMDLAMPYELGANIHLITRAQPFPTYDYEKEMVRRCGDRGRISDELTALLKWL